MPSRRKNTGMALDEIAPKFLKFCFIVSIMVFLLTLGAWFLSSMGPAERTVFVITIFASLCVMTGSGIAIWMNRRREDRERKAKEEAVRKSRPSGLTIDDWLDKNKSVE